MEKCYSEPCGKVNVAVGTVGVSEDEKKINLKKIKKEKKEQGINQIRETALNHPNIAMVKDVLGGEIVGVDISKEDEN